MKLARIFTPEFVLLFFFTLPALGQIPVPCVRVDLQNDEVIPLKEVPLMPCGEEMFTIFQEGVQSLLHWTSLPERSESGPVTQPEIAALAEHFGLTQRTDTNPHLVFHDGDISYWSEQNLTWIEYVIEFGSRRVVLGAADQCGVLLRDQGMLSWAAQRYMPFLRELLNDEGLITI